MAKDKSGLLIASLVAIVAVVALVMLLRGTPSGVMVYEMGGELGYRFDRPLGSNSYGVYGLDDNVRCWQEGGQITCEEADTASPVAGRNI